jgi:hypothetical protein
MPRRGSCTARLLDWSSGGAETEIRKAIELKYPEDKLIHCCARNGRPERLREGGRGAG